MRWAARTRPRTRPRADARLARRVLPSRQHWSAGCTGCERESRRPCVCTPPPPHASRGASARHPRVGTRTCAECRPDTGSAACLALSALRRARRDHSAARGSGGTGIYCPPGARPSAFARARARPWPPQRAWLRRKWGTRVEGRAHHTAACGVLWAFAGGPPLPDAVAASDAVDWQPSSRVAALLLAPQPPAPSAARVTYHTASSGRRTLASGTPLHTPINVSYRRACVLSPSR